ncbi:MAG: 4Fe-4S cluster-binding domain-containing protein [Bacilli bacterium]|jgi:pyruvate-formate lyase-activating enzyme
MIKYYNKIILSLAEIPAHPVLLIHGLTGCAFHCFRCFNYDSLIKATPKDPYLIDQVIDTILKQHDLFDYVVFSGGEFLRGSLDDLRSDLQAVKAATRKPIIVYTTGIELAKMKTLFFEGLIDGYHLDMKLPYHLLNKDDFDLIELTMGITVANLALFDTLLDALEFTVAYDKGYNRIRSVRYPFMGESAFEENHRYVYELNRKYGKTVPYDVNPFVNPEAEQTQTA